MNYSASLQVHQMATQLFINNAKDITRLSSLEITAIKDAAYRIAGEFYNELVTVIE